MAGAYKRPHQRKAGGTWTASYVDANGRRRYKAGFADKAKTLELARRLEAEAKLVKEGLIEARDQTARQAGSRPIAEHIEAYRAYLLSKGGTAKHSQHVAGAISRLCASASASRLADLRPERIQAAVARLKGERSARTANHALGSLKGFLRFLAGCGRLAEVPGWLAMLRPANERTGRKRVRRALTRAELRRLLEATRRGPDFQTRRGPRGRLQVAGSLAYMGGEDRYWLYRLAVETGLRASELGSLTPESFDLEAGTVKVQAAYSKHRRDDTIPLTPATIHGLGAHFVSTLGGQRLFPIAAKAGLMLARDLAAAGIPVKTEAGVIDFHALRHTFISNLIERGTDPKTAQELARHSTITLTIDRYSHTSEARKRAAVAMASAEDTDTEPDTETPGRQAGRTADGR